MESEEGVVALLDVDDPVVAVEGLSEDGEVVVVGEVSGLDVELEDGVIGSDVVDPSLLDHCVFKLMNPVMVVVADLRLHETPVGVDVGIDFNNYEAHINKI
jgi:hypothetical protein